jgi:hypothetical protein
MTMRLLPALLLAAFGTAAVAKLPAPDDAAKAKLAETTAKAAWQAKVDAYQLCRAQDRVASKYKAGGGKSAAPVKTAAAAPAQAAASAPAAAASAAGTPVASAPPAPCTDPGAFAYNPPEQKPLETSGAHSPSGTAASPPSVRPESAKMTPGNPTAGAGASSSGSTPAKKP